MTAPTAGEVAYMVAWGGNQRGQTLDGSHSYVTVQCDDSKTLFVSGHLYKTNLPNQQFVSYYKLDGSAPHQIPGSFTTSADGTGDFAFSVEGMVSGTHAVTVEINQASSNTTFFMDGSANSGGSGVPFTCP